MTIPMDEVDDVFNNPSSSQEHELFLSEYVQQLFGEELGVNAKENDALLQIEGVEEGATFFPAGSGAVSADATMNTTSTAATAFTTNSTERRKRGRSADGDNNDNNNNNNNNNKRGEGEGEKEKSTRTEGKKTTVLKQNANAQRRYRERIKKKSEEMENLVKDLQEKVRKLEAEIATQAPIEQKLLEHKSKLYESQLSMFKRARRAEIESSTLSSATTMNGTNVFDATGGEMLMANGMPEVPKQFTLPEGVKSLEEFKKQFPEAEYSMNSVGDVNANREVVEEETIVNNTLESLHYKWLKQISVLSLTNIEEKTNKKGNGADEVDEAKLSMKEASVNLINKMVDETCTLCMHIGRAIGRDNAKICFKYYDNMGFNEDFDVIGKDEDAKIKFYTNIITNLGLSEQQKQALIAVHDIAKEQFRRLFEARDRINDGMKELCAKGKENTKEGPKGLIRWLTGSSESSRALIVELRSNLVDERALAMDISMDVVHKILEPKQAARYLTEMYPLHPMGLVLCNAVYRLCK